jgi:hypothetical protein
MANIPRQLVLVSNAMPIPMNIRKDLIAASLELVGTMFFLLLGLGGIQAATAETMVRLCIQTAIYHSVLPPVERRRYECRKGFIHLDLYGLQSSCLCLDLLPVSAAGIESANSPKSAVPNQHYR